MERTTRLSPWRHEFVPAKGTPHTSPDLDASCETSKLCSLCRALQAWLQDKWNESKDVWKDESPVQHRVHHHETGHQLLQSSQNGCHLCTLVWHSFLDQYGSPERTVETILEGRNLYLDINKHEYGYLSIKSCFDLPKNNFAQCIINLFYKSPSKMPKRLPTISTSDTAIHHLSKEWLETCVTSHARCKQRKSSALPGRLLNVMPDGDFNSLRLVDTNSLTGNIEYIALSYCWGTIDQVKLTTDTKNSFVSGIATRWVSRTAQDAVNFTRRLGIKWLWVDALCILQDCQDDWDRESSKMCDVYQNSLLTLAALGASNCDDGLFALRNPLAYLPCELLKAGDYGSAYAAMFPFLVNEQSHWPLRQRKWAMQERILAPRTLSFGPTIAWQCREGSLDEYDVLPDAVSMRWTGLGQTLFNALEGKKRPDASPSEVDGEIYQAWQRILESYSRAALTVDTDNLKAIAGIITSIQNETGWKNLAGLWQPFLWKEVLWSKASYRWPDRSPAIRRRTGLGPTWSWVSVMGEIESWSMPLDPFHIHTFHVHHIGDVEEVKTNDLECLTKNGHLMSLEVSCIPVDVGNSSSPGEHHVDLINWTIGGEVSCEYDCDSDANPTLFLPLVGYDEVKLGCHIYGLAVGPSPIHAGAFERMGRISVWWNSRSLPADAFSRFSEPSARKTLILV